MDLNRVLSFGAELELADVDCSRDIPSDIGAWECGDKKNAAGYYIGKETCIMNTDGTVVDPDKVKCTKGGEIHTVPSYSIDTLLGRIEKIFKLFPEAKMFLPGKMHIHVGIPNWTLEEVKMIYRYTKDNDITLMEAMCPDSFMEEMFRDPKVSDSLKNHYLSSRKTITNPACFEKIEEFDTIKELTYWWGAKCLYHFPKPTIYYKGEYKPSKQSIRVQSIHIQHLLCHNTVEFRNFAPTMDLEEMRACLLVAERYIREALDPNGKPMKEWIGEYKLPVWKYDASIIQKWWDGARDGNSHIQHTAKSFHKFDVV